MLKGIDISKWQNTSAVDQAQDFVIIKATEGSGYVDPTCDTKYQYAKSKGKLLGVYHFARPDLTSAVTEADYFVSQTTGYWSKKEAILVLDWETGNTKNVAWAKAWLDRVYSKTGVKPLVYMSASVVGSADWSSVAKADYGLWIAGYPSKYNVTNPPTPAEGEMPYSTGAWGFAAIWQYTSSAGTLDRNVAYMTKEAWSKYAGKTSTPSVNWIPLSNPRNLMAVGAIKKFNVLTKTYDADASLQAGESRFFPTKTEVDGVAYLRTQADTDSNAQRGFKLSDLKEMPVITTKEETETTVIPFDTTRTPDPSRYVGDAIVVQDGVNGSRTVVTTVTYTDGVETGRVVTSDKTTNPKNQIIYYGTKEVVETPVEQPEVPSENNNDSEDSTNTQVDSFVTIILEQLSKLTEVIKINKSKIIAWVQQVVSTIWNAKK